MSVPVIVYTDKATSNPVADLDKARNIQYTCPINELWTASFDLPADDPKNDYFSLQDYAEVYDGDKRIELFRITDRIPARSKDEEVYRYKLTHVLDSLNDTYCARDKVQDVNGDWVNVTKTGVSTALDWILGLQSDWEQKGTLGFSYSYEYEFHRQTLLNALLALPKPWWEDFQITFDTTIYPWKINIIAPNTTATGTLRYSKNLQDIEKEESTKDLVTRLYAYGKGSGNDQIKAGPFDSNTATYGVIEGVWEEQFFDNVTDLTTAAQKYLAKKSVPRITYRGSAADLYRLADIDEINVGDYITIYDPKLTIDTQVRVVKLNKGDVMGRPGKLEFELANKSKKFPNYGALAFRDKATEDNLASGSVGGVGGGGALKKDTITAEEMAKDSIDFSFISFKDPSGDYLLGSRIKIGSAVQFEPNYSPLEKFDLADNTVDDLKDGSTYAKMLADWRSASDITTIAGGKIFTDSVDLDRINFSPTTSKNIVGQINANANGIKIKGQNIALSGNGISVNASDQLELVGGNAINITASGIETDESAINLAADQITITGLTTLDSWQYGTSTTIDGGQLETNTLSVGQVLVDSNINMSESGINIITGCESIANGTDAIFLTGGQVQAGSQILASNGIDMNTANITNPGTVDGVNLSFHAQAEKAHQTLIGGTDISVTYGIGQATIDFTGTAATSLTDLSDVDFSFPSSDEVLYYNGTEFTVESVSNITGSAPLYPIETDDISNDYYNIQTENAGYVEGYIVTSFPAFPTNVLTA